MKMKKNKIVAVFLFLQILLIGSVQARCDLESFQFGISYEALMSKLKLDNYYVRPKQKINDSEHQLNVSIEIVSAPGQKVCNSEKIFKDFPVEFLLIEDKLVEIKVIRLSKSPVLINWAEAIYGEKQNKPNSFYSKKPIANWFWKNSNAMIIYSIEPYEDKVSELMIIQSLNHQNSFDKMAIEL
tara:strand:- start:129 stop:680 length:552 start_codon:yes stop_codon:yes gene_type:complete